MRHKMYAEVIDNSWKPYETWVKDRFQREYTYYDRLHAEKYRDRNQSKAHHQSTLSIRLASNEKHSNELFDILHNERFLPAGRIQAALGATEREVSPFNCSVSGKIEDSIPSIYERLTQAAMILRLGTGIGYNFSHIRPEGDLIKSLQSFASGPLKYMDLYNQSAALISSAGHRRGAQMGILNVSHPDIEKFVDAKMEAGRLTSFNISVGITDAFMAAVACDGMWNLVFEGKHYKTISARYLWEKILKNAYESAEPGIVFLDRFNQMNNLWYCEHIEATNPCSEQPLPPYGLCTLGSFNLTQYLIRTNIAMSENIVHWEFDFDKFKQDIYTIVEAYDNVFDNAIYAIPEHREDALNKRRIGLGLTGIANAIEMIIGKPCYGEPQFNELLQRIDFTLAVTAYEASVELAKKRGPFPLFDPIKHPDSQFVRNLPDNLRSDIEKHGIRNSHLISYAPCGTISQCAGNVSSGVEPVFYHEVKRDVLMPTGKEQVTLTDWAYREHGFKGKTLEECTVKQHLAVGEICQRWCDSAVSKTVNVAPDCSYEDYSKIYNEAYYRGLKGISVYRPTELRGSVIVKSETSNEGKKPVEPIQAANTSELGTFTCASGVCER